MSKSKGDILTVSKLIEQGYDPLGYRLMVLNSHYRKQLLFTYDSLSQNENLLKKLRNKISNLSKDGELDQTSFDKYNSLFKAELENDLNTANALTVLFDLLKDDSVNGNTKLELIKNFDTVFSLDLIHEEELSENDAEIKTLIEKRAQAKKNKDFALADSIRDDLLSKGIELIDSREGTVYRIIK